MKGFRAQSAIEYITTYGWALLLIAIGLGALWQLGVIGGSSHVPNACIGSSILECSNPIMSTSGMLVVTLTNKYAGSVTITSTGCSSGPTLPSVYGYPTPSESYVTINENGNARVAFWCSLANNAIGSPASGTLWIRYNQKTTGSSQTGLLTKLATFTATVEGNSAAFSAFPSSGVLPSVLVSNLGSGSVSVIGAYNYTLYDTITGATPGGIAISPTTPLAYVAVVVPNGVVAVVNTITLSVVNTISVGSYPNAVAITSTGQKMYVTNLGGNTVSVINPATNAVISTIPVGNQPISVSFSTDDSEAFVSNLASNTISVINVGADAVINTINVGAEPYSPKELPNSTELLVTNYGSNTVSIINPSNFVVTNTVSGFLGPYALTFTPDGSEMLVVDNYNDRLYFVNLTTQVSTYVAVGHKPSHVEVSPSGTQAWVSNAGSNTISVVNISSEKVIRTIGVGIDPITLKFT